MYDQVGCMVFGKVRRFGISITLPRGRWRVWHFSHSTWRPNPGHNSAPRDGGSGVDHSLIINGELKPPPLGLISP